MKIISFAWTTEALVEGRKTQTRRFWKDRYAKLFKKGDLVQAYDRNPRMHGKRIAIIRLTKDAYKQKFEDMSDEDFIAEGDFHKQMSKSEFIMGLICTSASKNISVDKYECWVVEFELVAIKGKK